MRAHPAAREQGENVVRPDVQVDEVHADALDEDGVAGRARQPVIADAKYDHVWGGAAS